MRTCTASLTSARSRFARQGWACWPPLLTVALMLLVAGPWLATAHAAASSRPAPSLQASPSTSPCRRERGRVQQERHYPQGATADWVVVFGGKVDVAGTVTHMIIAIGGDVVLEPTAVVGTKLDSSDTALVVVGGHLTRAPAPPSQASGSAGTTPVSASGTGTSGASSSAHWFFFGPI